MKATIGMEFRLTKKCNEERGGWYKTTHFFLMRWNKRCNNGRREHWRRTEIQF